MNNLEVLKDLHDRQLLKPLIVSGIVPAKVLTYMEMFYHVDAQTKRGTNKKHAVCMTAACFNITPRSVYRALECFKNIPKKVA